MSEEKKVAIIQSNYIPWKGYFDIIRRVDAFVLLDDVQFTRRDWRNRNLIKTQSGLKWLTIPVKVKGQFYIKIQDVYTEGTDWRKDHWNMIEHAYKTAPYFESYKETFRELYLSDDDENLSSINFKFLTLINQILNISTPIRFSREFEVSPEKSERLLQICQHLGATTYLSGPAAQDYLNVASFESHHIGVEWMRYPAYPEYPQLHGPFEHGVSILDMIFNVGPDAPKYF
jgi:hypothetical protein